MRSGIVIIIALALGGCGSSDTATTAASDAAPPASGSAEPMKVVATTMQVQDFARAVGGDKVTVEGILGAGDDPHEYEPTPSDADNVSAAKVIVESGAGLDRWLDGLLENAPDATKVVATDGITLLPTAEQGFPGDPHVWHDPDNAKRMVANIEAGFARADPANAATYQANATAYEGQLDAMAAQIRQEFSAVAPADRKLVTNHDAFGYFARAYGVTVVGNVLSSLTTATEPSAKQLQALTDTIRRENVKAIFTEEAIDPKLETQIASAAGVRVEATLYGDVLGEPGSPGATYIGSELANAQAMLAAWRS